MAFAQDTIVDPPPPPPPLEISGCTDEEACNFNEDATIDNESCTYYPWIDAVILFDGFSKSIEGTTFVHSYGT